MEYRIQVQQEDGIGYWRICAAGQSAVGKADCSVDSVAWREVTARELAHLNGISRFWHKRQKLEASFCQAAGIPYLPVDFVLGQTAQDGFIKGARWTMVASNRQDGCWWLPAAAAWLIVTGGQISLPAAQAWDRALAARQLHGPFSLLYGQGKILPSGDGRRLVYTLPSRQPSTARLKRLEHSWTVQRLAGL